MNLSRAFATLGCLVAIVVAFALYAVRPVQGSDHQDSNTALSRPGADITDLYVFPAPDNAKNVVLAMDVNPFIPTGMGAQTSFDPSVLYQFKIAHTSSAYPPAGSAASSAVEDMVIQFVPNGTGSGQTLTMYGPAAPAVTGTSSTFVGATGTIPYNHATTVSVNGNSVQVYAGPRADPFFFDYAQFFKIFPDEDPKNHTQVPSTPSPTVSSFRGFTAGNASSCDITPAQDFMATNKYNVLSIVVEMPRALLAPDASKQVIHAWATTSTQSGT